MNVTGMILVTLQVHVSCVEVRGQLGRISLCLWALGIEHRLSWLRFLYPLSHLSDPELKPLEGLGLKVNQF